MKEESLELLSAFLDGEDMEPQELAEALSTDGAREALLDFALLRVEMQYDDGIPEAGVTRSIRRALRTGKRGAWFGRAIPVPAGALAAVLVLAVGLSVWAGLILKTVPLDAPPDPERVIRFEPGVDWQEMES